MPPGADPENWTLLGYGAEEINDFAFTALTRRLKVIGVDLGAAVGLTPNRGTDQHHFAPMDACARAGRLYRRPTATRDADSAGGEQTT